MIVKQYLRPAEPVFNVATLDVAPGYVGSRLWTQLGEIHRICVMFIKSDVEPRAATALKRIVGEADDAAAESVDNARKVLTDNRIVIEDLIAVMADAVRIHVGPKLVGLAGEVFGELVIQPVKHEVPGSPTVPVFNVQALQGAGTISSQGVLV